MQTFLNPSFLRHSSATFLMKTTARSTTLLPSGTAKLGLARSTRSRSCLLRKIIMESLSCLRWIFFSPEKAVYTSVDVFDSMYWIWTFWGWPRRRLNAISCEHSRIIQYRRTPKAWDLYTWATLDLTCEEIVAGLHTKVATIWYSSCRKQHAGCSCVIFFFVSSYVHTT